MGCIENQSVSPNSLRGQLTRIKYSSDIHKCRAEAELVKAEKLLTLEIIKPQKLRNKAIQRLIIVGNARLLNQKNIYLLIQNQAKIILERTTLLQHEADLSSVKEPMNIVLYCSTFMDFEDLKNFGNLFHSHFPNYPLPKDKDISNEDLKAEKNNDVKFQSEIEYIFQYSLNHQIAVDLINAAGHNYKYGAEKYQTQTK